MSDTPAQPAELTLPVHERFITFQGEGVHTGRKAFFIRTMGCPVKCPWCDSAGTWHPNYLPPALNRMTVAAIISEIVAADPAFVVLTGGEPLIHRQLSTIARMIRREGYPVHVETCGAFIPEDLSAFDWITVSPKWAKLPAPEMLAAANEFKIIMESANALERWSLAIDTVCDSQGVLVRKDAPVWLHPEWSQRDNPEVLNAITSAVVRLGDPFRAGWQMHKLYRCDALDSRSAPLVPLGGNPALGH